MFREDNPVGFAPGRIHYVKHLAGIRRYVIYDRLPDGNEYFSDQEPFEVRWFEFRPCEEEIQAARWLLTMGRGVAGWDEHLEAVLEQMKGPEAAAPAAGGKGGPWVEMGTVVALVGSAA